MAKRHTLILLLLAWFLFMSFQRDSTPNKVQATKSVHFKRRSLLSSSTWQTKYHVPSWDDMKKFHKAPSGPNPVGNQRPPTSP